VLRIEPGELFLCRQIFCTYVETSRVQSAQSGFMVFWFSLFSRLHSQTQQSLLGSLVPKMSMKEVELSVWEFRVVCLVAGTLIKLD